MSAALIDGKAVAARLKQALAARIAALGRAPRLAILSGAEDSASFITPVPSGVGPVTTALLLANTVSLAGKSR